MSIATLIDALTTLRAAFRAPGLIGPDDVVVVELPDEVGRQFEAWLAQRMPHWKEGDTFETVYLERKAPTPYRQIGVAGVTVRWAVRQIALPGGGLAPEPAAVMATLPTAPELGEVAVAPAAMTVKADPDYPADTYALSGGGAVSADHKELKPNGQQKGYVVLTETERRKGFVRPVRRAYVHVGLPAPKNPLRDLTPEEHERYDQYAYAKYETYPASDSSVVGRFWTQADLDKVDKGCGTLTTMSQDLAETHAHKPGFYGATFCCGCGTHLPVGEHGEFVWYGTTERVGT